MKRVKIKDCEPQQGFRYYGSAIINFFEGLSPCGNMCSYWTEDPESGNYVSVAVPSDEEVFVARTESKFTTHIGCCVRCGLDHEDVVFQRLDNSESFTHWGLCPTTKQPILMSIWGHMGVRGEV